MPDIEIKYAVKERSDFEAITYSINKMPWPIAQRELLLYNRLRLDRSRKLFVVEVYSIFQKIVGLRCSQPNLRTYLDR